MKTKLLFALICLSLLTTLPAQTSLVGKVTDDTGEPIIFGSIALYKNDVLITGTETDTEGHYALHQIGAGTYDLEASYVGYSTKRIEGVKVIAGKTNRLDITMSSDGVTLDEVAVVDYRVPMVEQDNTTHGQTIRSDQIRNLPTRHINGLSGSAAGISTSEEGNTINARGSRSAPTTFYKNGIEGKPHRPNGEAYAGIVENKFQPAAENRFSTFAIDVDGASYSNVRRFIQQGQLPPADAVRLEELINYFDYNYPIPEGEHPFSVVTELGPCPWSEGHQLLHIGIRGYEPSPSEAPPANLVFLIDVSGSMGSANKLPLVKASLKLLVDQLRAKDRVAMVTYAGGFEVPLLPTPGDQKEAVKKAIDQLGAGGGTAGGAALQRAYELAEQYFVPGGSNRVLLATDGDFNIGISKPEELQRFIAEKRATGIDLSVLGFGTGNYKDDRMETLAQHGNGNYAYIDGIEEAEKVLIAEMAGTLFTIARDVKLQVEFSSDAVASYRLIGYENRLLAKEDFEDDTKDAGELGAGHTVSALYEIVPQPSTEGQLATVHLRYKRPRSEQSFYLRHSVGAKAIPLAAASENFRFSAAVATYGLCLRQSAHRGNATYAMAEQLADGARQDDLEQYRAGFVELVKQTQQLQQQIAVQSKE